MVRFLRLDYVRFVLPYTPCIFVIGFFKSHQNRAVKCLCTNNIIIFFEELSKHKIESARFYSTMLVFK